MWKLTLLSLVEVWADKAEPYSSTKLNPSLRSVQTMDSTHSSGTASVLPHAAPPTQEAPADNLRL